jgi:hypothetical protein
VYVGGGSPPIHPSRACTSPGPRAYAYVLNYGTVHLALWWGAVVTGGIHHACPQIGVAIRLFHFGIFGIRNLGFRKSEGGSSKKYNI